jgi:hypothetical protein
MQNIYLVISDLFIKINFIFSLIRLFLLNKNQLKIYVLSLTINLIQSNHIISILLSIFSGYGYDCDYAYVFFITFIITYVLYLPLNFNVT